MITVAQAARIADVSPVTVHRWIRAGGLTVAHSGPEENSPVLLDEQDFLEKWPGVKAEMAARRTRGGRAL